MATVKVYSQASNDKAFPIYEKVKEGDKGTAARRFKSSVLIKGGANVVNKKTKSAEKFVVTEVEKEDFEQIKDNPVFKRAIENGFFSLDLPKADKKDKAAQLTEKEVKAKNPNVKIETNKPEAQV